jgi:hypothetical protein
MYIMEGIQYENTDRQANGRTNISVIMCMQVMDMRCASTCLLQYDQRRSASCPRGDQHSYNRCDPC